MPKNDKPHGKPERITEALEPTGPTATANPSTIPYGEEPVDLIVTGAGYIPGATLVWEIHGTAYLGQTEASPDGTIMFPVIHGNTQKNYTPNFVQTYYVAIHTPEDLNTALALAEFTVE